MKKRMSLIFKEASALYIVTIESIVNIVVPKLLYPFVRYIADLW